MLRSHHLRLYNNTHKKLKKYVAAEYLGMCVAGVYRRRFKVLYGVITLSSDVSPYLGTPNTKYGETSKLRAMTP